jgi:hypothetical protein
MTTENLDQEIDQNTAEDTQLTAEQKADGDLISKLVKEGIEEALKPIKSNLDKAYGERDRYKDQLEKIEKEKREAELKRLEEEGKHKEVYEARLKEEREAREKLERQNIELTRNIEVRNSLSTLQFRNANALEMAQKEIVGQLVRNDQGFWVHRSGISIQDFVKAFADNDENAFLFKVKVSSGGGSTSSTSIPVADVKKKSLFEMSQEEVIKLAQEGKLRKA